jgi:hypothetical protein
MPARRLPANAEVAVRAHVEPILLKGGGTVKSLSATFLADLEEDWRLYGKEIFPILRGKYRERILPASSLWRVSSSGNLGLPARSIGRALPKRS